MESLPPFRRYETPAGVQYEVLSSTRKFYYSVFLLNGIGISCECRHRNFNPTCKHIEFAEAEEAKLKPPEKPTQAEKAPLNNRNAGFSVLR